MAWKSYSLRGPNMTRSRIFGSDHSTLSWIRQCDALDSADGFVMTDVDVIVHRYMTEVWDAQSQREGRARQIKAIMGVEIKTRNADVEWSQSQTLWQLHRTIKKSLVVEEEQLTIRNFGWSFLRLSHTTPDDSERIRWGRFDDTGRIIWIDITPRQLVRLLSFELHPDSLSPRIFQRHHKTQEYTELERAPLGFMIETKHIHRS